MAPLAEAYIDERGEGHAGPLRQLVFRRADSEMVPVPFPPSYDGKLLRALLHERNVDGATLEQVYLGKDEGEETREAVRQVLLDAIGTFSAMVFHGEGVSEGRKSLELSTGISLAYLRGMAKTAFHYYLAVCPTHTGAELVFQPLRDFVRVGNGDWRSFVSLVGPHFVNQLIEGQTPQEWNHFLAFNKVRGEVVVELQFFVGPDQVLPPVAVRLGATSRPIEGRCHRIVYFGAKLDGYDGEIETLCG